MPWKVFGPENGILPARDFAPGEKVHWEVELLEELCRGNVGGLPSLRRSQFLWDQSTESCPHAGK